MAYAQEEMNPATNPDNINILRKKSIVVDAFIIISTKMMYHLS